MLIEEISEKRNGTLVEVHLDSEYYRTVAL